MKSLLFSLIFLCSAAGSCDAKAALDDWNPTNKALFVSYSVLNVIDVAQTFDLIDCQRNPYKKCRYYETNSIVGTHPNKSEIVFIKFLSVYGTYHLLDKYGDEREKFIALSIVNMMYFQTVMNNHEIGLRFSFKF